MVLVWYWFLIVLIVWEEAAGSRSHRKSMKMASTSSENEQILRKTALKSAKTSRQTQFRQHAWREVACGALLRRIETIFIENFEILATYEVTLEKMASDGSGIQYHFLIVLGNGF